MRKLKSITVSFVGIVSGLAVGTIAIAAIQSVTEPRASLPNNPGSLKFVVLGGSGTGEPPQYQLAEQMAIVHRRLQYSDVILVGDNIHGSERPRDYLAKFETPYKPLLDAGVRFHASLGREDSREQRHYKLFNMAGRSYYTFSPTQDVQFFALDTNTPAPDQLQWLEQQLQTSDAAWKIAFFHDPVYSSGKRRESDAATRSMLEPLFVKHGVSVVLTGRDRFYERTKSQKGIVYFVVGSGGKVQSGAIDKTSGISVRAVDTDLVFLAVEISGDELHFNAISRAGQTVDSGVVRRPTR